jgi:hypothetical protein
VIFGEGWRDPGRVEGMPARRTRTRAAHLLVPVRDPADYRVTLRARAEESALPFEVELVVEGASAGRRPAAAGWQEYAFDVRRGALHSGFNAFVLRLPGAPRDRRPELAAATLALARAAPLTARAAELHSPIHPEGMQ